MNFLYFKYSRKRLGCEPGIADDWRRDQSVFEPN